MEYKNKSIFLRVQEGASSDIKANIFVKIIFGKKMSIKHKQYTLLLETNIITFNKLIMSDILMYRLSFRFMVTKSLIYGVNFLSQELLQVLSIMMKFQLYKIITHV